MNRLLMPFFVTVVVAVVSLPAAAAKSTVCTVTINSKEERDVFQAKLNPADFDFIELTEYSSDIKEKRSDWFQKACEAGVKCDVLVVSGHFGGEFFGSSGFNLGLNDMNKYSCYNRCDGIMSHPKEVYLFGCNTLATKDKDHRDEQSYLEVLLRDNIDRMEAERRVAARYGPFGSSFKDQIERSFENVPLIYGFTSVGPAGAHIKPSLAKYLTQIGDYKKHLASISYGSKPHPAWAQNMKFYPAAVGLGLRRSSRVYDIKENSCRFTSDDLPIHERLELAMQLLANDPYTYLPTISHFVREKLGRYPSFQSDSDRQQTERAIERISARQDLRKLVLKTAHSTAVTPSIKVDILDTARLLKWMSDDEFAEEMRRVFDPLVKNPTTQNADLACSLIVDDESNARFIRMEHLLNIKFDEVGHFRFLECSKKRDPRLTKLALEGAIRNRSKWRDIMAKFYVLGTFLEAPGHGPEILNFANTFKGHRGLYEAEFKEFLARFAIAKSVGKDQVQAVRAAAQRLDVSNLSDVLNDLISNDHPELASLTLLFDRILLLPEKVLDESFHFRTETKFPRVAGFEEYLDLRWNQMPQGLFRLQMIEFIAKIPKLQNKSLRLNLVSDFESSSGRWYNYNGLMAEILAKADLDADEILHLRKLLKDSEKFQVHGSARHILYQQALAGHTELTEDISHSRTKYSCTDNGRSRSCGPMNY